MPSGNELNNREWATLFWLVAFLIWVFWRKETRSSLVNVARAAANPWIWGPFLALLSWTAGMVALASSVHLWTGDLIKDTVVWAVGPALALYLNIAKMARQPRFLRRVVFGAFKYSVFVDFYINLYVSASWPS